MNSNLPEGSADPKPELKQFADLRWRDFERHPAWVHCHVIDYDEPWYDETDEVTVRPCAYPVPIDPVVTMYLVRASATLANGRVLPGFMTPDQWDWEGAGTAEKIGYLQPHLFLPSGEMIGFWEGSRGATAESIDRATRDRNVLYDGIDRDPSIVFPIHFETAPHVTTFPTSLAVEGFYFIEVSGTYENPGDVVGIER